MGLSARAELFRAGMTDLQQDPMTVMDQTKPSSILPEQMKDCTTIFA